MKTKKFQGLKIAQVKERLSSYRIQLNDNTLLDLPKIELGEAVPQKGMFVRLRFYHSLILQRVEFDGQIVINRSVADLMAELYRIDDKLETDVRKETGNSEDILYGKLSDVFRQRVDMLYFIRKIPEFREYQLQDEAAAFETAACYQAEKLAKLGLNYLKKFSGFSLYEQQTVMQNNIEQAVIDYIIELAGAFLQQCADKKEKNCRTEYAPALAVPYCINLSKEEHQILLKAFTNHLN